MPPKIDWTRPIENQYGPCKLLCKLKNDLPKYLVVSLDEKGQEIGLEYNDEGLTIYYPTNFNLRNVVERKVFFVPFYAERRYGLTWEGEETRLVINHPQETMPLALEGEHVLRITFENDTPLSVEILTLPKDAE